MAQRIVSDLVEGGYLTRQRDPLPGHRTVGESLRPFLDAEQPIDTAGPGSA